MADDAREYIRAAQQAEVRGDRALAVDLLMKAAVLYKGAGNVARALQLLRHARRLDGTREDLAEEVNRLEWIPDNALARAVGVEEESETALEPLNDLEQKSPLVERGPTRADAALKAWCSFCCKPKAEVGELIAGPAGSFICQSCVRESYELLGLAPPPVAETAPAGMVPIPPVPNEPPIELVGQTEAISTIEGALRVGARLVLVVGPAGSGKTTYLRALARAGVGHYVEAPDRVTSIPVGLRLLVDTPADVPPAAFDSLWARLCEQPHGQLVIAVRGALPPPSFVADGGGRTLPIYSTDELCSATEGRLPPALAERVQAVAAFGALTQDDAKEIARRLFERRAAELDLSEELLTALAEKAQRSARGGHELRALIERIPAGSWTLSALAPAPPPPKKRRDRKKKVEG